MMYECFFSRLDITLPFSPFQIGVLRYLQLYPTQLHPNAWGYIVSFERFCIIQKLYYTPRLFFSMFKPMAVKHSE